MKILHICLGNLYIENMGYQENFITRFHAAQGHEVGVITTLSSAKKKENIEGEYKNAYNVTVKILNKVGFLSRYGRYPSLYTEITAFKPDIIFVHGGQFISLDAVRRYCKKNRNVRLYIDQHADYYNTPVNTFRRRAAAGYIYGHFIRRIVKYTRKFWGVTPWRCQYLNDVYGVPKEKISLLVMGGDDTKIHFERQDIIRREIRGRLKLADDDFVLITGGKIGKTKNIHLLMQAVKNLNNPKLKLIVFGKPTDDMKKEILGLSGDEHIRFIDWLAADAVFDYFLASDLGVFPGTHSVLWEQACACGLPCLFKNWEGMHHVDVGGNCKFMREDSSEEIAKCIDGIFRDKDKYKHMKCVAREKAVQVFSYDRISKTAIEATD